MRLIEPYIHTDKYILYVGDNADIIPYLSFKDSVIITSPPYNFDRNYTDYNDNIDYSNYLEFLRYRFELLFLRAERDTRLIVVLKDDFVKFNFLNFDFYQVMKEIGWKMYNYFIIESNHISKFTAWGSWKSASAPRVRVNHEVIQVYYKESYKRLSKGISTITDTEFKESTLSLIKDSNLLNKQVNKKLHPAQFSPELIKKLIKLYSYQTDIIIDLFCGVGNTGIAAIELKRKFIGIDISKQYIDITHKRLETLVKEVSDDK